MSDEGRTCHVLRDLQHAFEMLLKAALVQNQVPVFDKRVGIAIGFEKCVNLSIQNLELTEDEAGTLRAIGALRDAEQHWIGGLTEGLLHVHVRAGFTLFGELLQRVFGEPLSKHFPHRVLPINSEPPRDIQLLIGEEYEQIAQLLAPGRRRTTEAQTRIRSLLALEAHLRDDVRVSRKDLAQVQRQIKSGKARSAVFPDLDNLASEVAGEGVTLTVRFSKKEGGPVRLMTAEDPDTPAAALREVNRQDRFRWSPGDLAVRCGLTPPKCFALRRHLGIEGDDTMVYEFVFGKQKIRRYSDKADKLLREKVEEVDMHKVWQQHRPGRRRCAS